MEQDEVVIAKRVEETTKEVYKALDAIARKPNEAFTYDDKAFLQARQSYLTTAQREQYADVLAEELPAKKKK